MKNIFNMENVSFNDNSSVIKIINRCEPKWNKSNLLKELAILKKELNPNGDVFLAIEKLENALYTEDDKIINSTVKTYIKEFSMPFFANVASEALIQFIKFYS